MPPKINTKRIVFIGIVAFLAIFAFLFALGASRQSFRAQMLSIMGSVSNTATVEHMELSAVEISGNLPVRLKIPKIDVNADIEYVGLAESGTMDVPTKPENVAWFNLSSRPGQEGSSVIAGHFGWKNGIPAVFDSLSELRVGDRLYVENENGSDTVFVVSELRIYGENETAIEVFNSTDGKAHLNLVTCGGTWNKAERSYSNRLVIFSDKEIQ